MDLVEIEHRLTAGEAKIEANIERLDELEKRQDDLGDLVSTVKVLAVREETVEKDVKEIKSDVKNLTSKPAKKWEILVSQIITLLVAAVAGFIFAKIGL